MSTQHFVVQVRVIHIAQNHSCKLSIKHFIKKKYCSFDSQFDSFTYCIIVFDSNTLFPFFTHREPTVRKLIFKTSVLNNIGYSPVWSASPLVVPSIPNIILLGFTYSGNFLTASGDVTTNFGEGHHITLKRCTYNMVFN